MDNWITNQDYISNYTASYFKNIYTTNHIYSKLMNTINILTTFANINLSNLDRTLTDEEIMGAINSFKPYKSLDLDGLHLFFYKKYWDAICPSVIDFCHNVFATSIIPSIINCTYLCLISKTHSANNLKNFRPIDLSNTIYKIVNKIVVNRIKHYL